VLRGKAILELLYASRIRASKLTAINLEDVNLNTREILIKGKAKKERIVLYSSKAEKALIKYIEARSLLLEDQSKSALFLSHSYNRIL